MIISHHRLLSYQQVSLTNFVSWPTAGERAQQKTKAPLSKSKRGREWFPGILIPGGASRSFFMPTASFPARYLHQHISFSRSILLRMNFPCRDIEFVVKKTYTRRRAHSGLRLYKAGGRRASGRD